MYRLLLTLTILFTGINSYSQLQPSDALKKLYDNFPQEKIYMWFNKPQYVAGETIWFKIYVFSGYELSNISTNVYVELYNKEKKLIHNILLPLLSGTGQGSVPLDEKLPEDIYYIRGYTRWMNNFDESLQYIHPLTVLNPSSSLQLAQKKQPWVAKAFPEGGWLIDGINTKVAIRLNSPLELPGEWSGYVYEEGNLSTPVAEFTALDENAAIFSFTPLGGKKYLASVTDKTGYKQTVALPAVRRAGLGFSVENQGDSIICRLNFKAISGIGQTYKIIGHMQHQLVYLASFKKNDAVVKVVIPSKELFNGILHITVFNEMNSVMAERLVFVNPGKLFINSSGIENSSLSQTPRSLTNLDIQVDSLSWGSYAMSVTNSDAPFSTQKENILSSLWLTSDFTSNIHEPASYFNNPTQQKIEALDALLISEKWKRFSWNDLLSNRYPVLNYLPHNYLSYSATVTRNKKLLPNRELSLILYAPDSSSQFMLIKTDNTSSFSFDNFGFEGSVKAFYQLNEKKGMTKNIDVSFSRDNRSFTYSAAFPETGYTQEQREKHEYPRWVTNTITTIKNEKDLDAQYKTLEAVVVRSKLKSSKEQLENKLSGSLFKGGQGVSFDFVNEEQNALGYSNILQWLDGRVAGLNVELQDGVYVPFIRGDRASVFLDEMPYSADGLSSISISDIALIKVIKGPTAFVTGGGSGGVIAIYTARGNMRPAQLEPSLNNSILKGYDAEKKFQLPEYTNKSIRQPEKDTRDQLLWSSLLLPNRSITINRQQFVTNDSPGKTRIIVQGFTDNGFPVYMEKILEPQGKAANF